AISGMRVLSTLSEAFSISRPKSPLLDALHTWASSSHSIRISMCMRDSPCSRISFQMAGGEVDVSFADQVARGEICHVDQVRDERLILGRSYIAQFPEHLPDVVQGVRSALCRGVLNSLLHVRRA